MSIPNSMPPFDDNRYVSAYCEGQTARDKWWIERESKMLNHINNKILPKIKRGETIGRITVGNGMIEDIFICDKYGDEIPDTSHTLTRQSLKKSLENKNVR